MPQESLPFVKNNDLADKVKNAMNNSMSYQQYRDLGVELHAQNKTTGLEQSESLLNYSKMNDHRMKRLDKTIELDNIVIDSLKTIKNKQTWIAITELWCGDAAQNIPVIQKITDLNSNIDFRLVLRDDNPDLMDLFLTNGGKSIPIIIALDDKLNFLWKWGPRPKHAQQMLLDYKKQPEPKISYEQFAERLHKWYADNKTKDTQKEISLLISNN